VYVKTTIAYRYEPASFFDEVTSLVIDAGSIIFDSGAATVTLSTATDRVAREMVDAVTLSVRAALQPRQLVNRALFTLRAPSVTQVQANGSVDAMVIPGTGNAVAAGGALSVTVTAPDGTVTYDGTAARFGRGRDLVNSISVKLGRPATLNRMLESFSASIADSDNELVHLYDIRDAIGEHYGGANAARTALGIPSSDWSTLGRIANQEPVRQGRHRGQHLNGLRDASTEELACARAIAQAIIAAFASTL
jgi:hypothetical protein